MRSAGAKRVLLYALLIMGAVVALFPLLWMISASFMPTGAANSYPPRILPSHPTLAHYREIFTRFSMGRFVLNSVIISFIVTFVSLFVNSMAGYAFAKLRFSGRERLFRVLTLGLVVPVQVAIAHSSGSRILDDAARQHGVATWRFHPAIRAGRAIEAWALIPVRFDLNRG